MLPFKSFHKLDSHYALNPPEVELQSIKAVLIVHDCTIWYKSDLNSGIEPHVKQYSTRVHGNRLYTSH